MASQFFCNKAIFKIVPNGAAYVNVEELLSATFPDECTMALVGYLRCPRGCGALIYWALSPEMIPYKEKFLTFLNQQLCWTACPDHTEIQNQHAVAGSVDEHMVSLPSSSTVMAGGRRYRNLYE